MNPQFQNVLQQAIQAFRSGNFDGAASILGKVLQEDINSADAIFQLGIAYAKDNRFMEASAVFCCLYPYKNDDVRIPYNLGLSYSLQGKHQLALEAYDLALNIKPNDPEVLINKGSTCNDIKNYVLALGILEKAIQIRPDIPEAWFNKGIALYELKRYDEAIAHYEKAVTLKPDYVLAWFNKGLVLYELKRYDEAIAQYDKAITLRPDDSEAWCNKGVTLHALKHYDEAITCYDKVLSLNPDYAEAWYNKGLVSYDLRRYDEAIADYEKAIALKPDYADAWCTKGVTLHKLKRYDEAIVHYDKAITLKFDHFEAWCNKGVTLHVLKRYDGAIAHYDKVLSLNPDYAEAWNNKGLVLYDLKRYDEAIAQYDKAITLKPDYAEAWFYKGLALQDLQRFDEAIAHYDKTLSLKPDMDWVYGYLLNDKMKICGWSTLENDRENIAKKVLTDEKVISPFLFLAIDDNAFLNKKCSEIYAQSEYPVNPKLGTISKRATKEKIRIAYFSPDFRSHPVSFLTAELFEIHDRHRFEVFAFSLTKSPIGDEINLRLRKGFDRFIDSENMSDQEVAQLARELEIDIAIDLAGPTLNARTGIFSYRAAPIQVNWLGYPGTIGADFIDYIVADKTIIPKLHQEFYVEKVVHLPDTYMVDDSKRLASSRVFTKGECGLPENAFVFCCFNNDYKFNPQVLDGWARILLATKDSVMWVPKHNENFIRNFTSEFERRGIDSERIIYAQRQDLMADHLARYMLADLFLDTFPFNAHTTAVDSLKAGVPVLTLMGQSFASRVAASLLNAIGLPELITNTQEEYEALAIELALNPKKFLDIKLKLTKNRLTAPLFDTPLFTKNLEAAYIKMYERYQADLEPEHITII